MPARNQSCVDIRSWAELRLHHPESPLNSEADITQALTQLVSQLLKEEFGGAAVNHFVRPEDNPELFDLLRQEVLADLTARSASE